MSHSPTAIAWDRQRRACAFPSCSPANALASALLNFMRQVAALLAEHDDREQFLAGVGTVR
jgi:hypothetical protein